MAAVSQAVFLFVHPVDDEGLDLFLGGGIKKAAGKRL